MNYGYLKYHRKKMKNRILYIHLFFKLGRLKVNMGNIYLKQRNYSKAIKFYRMALDQIPSVHKEMRWVYIMITCKICVIFQKQDNSSDLLSVGWTFWGVCTWEVLDLCDVCTCTHLYNDKLKVKGIICDQLK